MTQFNDMQSVKRQFFAYRNGIIADTMRKAGSPFKIIFGLNIPQIKQIASKIGKNKALAAKLWNNNTTRESMLLAPMIYPADELDIAEAFELSAATCTPEIADGLCHNLLKKTAFVENIIEELKDSERDMDRYIALRLSWTLLPERIDFVESLAKAESTRDSRLTRGTVRQILDEIEWFKSASC